MNRWERIDGFASDLDRLDDEHNPTGIPEDRRLMAILAADVAGYSRLVGADEGGSLAQWTAHWDELIEPRIKEYRGIVVRITGDGILTQFPSVVNAVRCAIVLQRGMAARNAGVASEKRIEFRIGVNVGDVIIKRGDIWGEGVNVAARLQAMAEPGGICVSRLVHEYVMGKLDVAFADLGERQLKNITRPVQVYRVDLHDARLAPASSAAPTLVAAASAFASRCRRHLRDRRIALNAARQCRSCRAPCAPA